MGTRLADMPPGHPAGLVLLLLLLPGQGALSPPSCTQHQLDSCLADPAATPCAAVSACLAQLPCQVDSSTNAAAVMGPRCAPEVAGLLLPSTATTAWRGTVQ